MTARRHASLAAALAAALALAGCATGRRYSAVEPGVNQSLRVESGDRVFFEMEEDAKADGLWEATCDDGDVEVRIDHAGRAAKVEIRIHRGYDGPSTVTFSCRRANADRPSRRFTVALFRRTGDAAFWE
ncbi:MAG: hypothetical protein J6T51_05895 [Kiritimatiellae bacterium]|nr:hypothetical protein [Kiritimatiellia bacterium]